MPSELFHGGYVQTHRHIFSALSVLLCQPTKELFPLPLLSKLCSPLLGHATCWCCLPSLCRFQGLVSNLIFCSSIATAKAPTAACAPIHLLSLSRRYRWLSKSYSGVFAGLQSLSDFKVRKSLWLLHG